MHPWMAFLLVITVHAHWQTVNAQDSSQQEEPAQQTEFTNADSPPVKRIVFFNSGIAQVVHQGKVTGSQLVEVDFDRNQVDDVLKSIVFDNESGTIESVQYHPAPGKEALAAGRLGPPMTLAQTLQNYRGEVVSLLTKDGIAKGAILSVENRTSGKESHDLVSLVTKDGIQSVGLPEVKTIKFESSEVRKEFEQAMIGISNSRVVEKETLSMFFKGDGQRNIQFGYVVDAPVWRMTYRLDIGKEKATLQGWAHVDNVSGFDWENVFVDLRSGRPQAFSVELFSPLVATRSKRARSIFGIPAGLALNAYGHTYDWIAGGRGDSGGSRPFVTSVMRGGGFGGGGMGGGAGGMGGGGTFGGATESQKKLARAELKIGEGIWVAAAQGRTTGMLQFAIEEPINLASGRSAMLPVMTEPVETELITRFDVTVRNPTAQLVAKLTNGDRFPIAAGPVTIYQKGNFIGDAALERTDIAEETMLPYGEDQPLSLVVSKTKQETINQRVRLEKRELVNRIVVDRVNRRSRSYTLANKGNTVRSVQLKMNTEDSILIPSPMENSGSTATYEFDVVGGTTIVKTIVLERPDPEELEVSRVTRSLLERWETAGLEIDEQVKKRMSVVFQAQDKVKKLERVASLAGNEVRLNESEQERLTKIIAAVKSDTSGAQFINKLTALDEKLAELRVKMRDADDALGEAREELRREQNK